MINKLDKLKELFNIIPPDFNKIESILNSTSFSDDELTDIAIHIVDNCFCEYHDAILREQYTGEKFCFLKTNSAHLYNSLNLLLDNGLKPNHIINSENPFYNLIWVDMENVAANCFLLFLDCGGNPDLRIDSETMLEYLYYKFFNSSIEPFEFHIFQCILVLLIYGAKHSRIKTLKLNMLNNHKVEEMLK